jgi:serine kinase of HPr protein (carbohydrate metabolism regulator)
MNHASNLHATALVIGTRGFMFIGEPGSGKTSLALACLAQAQARGIFAAFVGDDQVMVSNHAGAIIAQTIASIAGRAEIRGADIVDVPAIAAAVIDFAARPSQYDDRQRLAPEDEEIHIDGIGSLPLLRLPIAEAEILDKLLRLAEQRA